MNAPNFDPDSDHDSDRDAHSGFHAETALNPSAFVRMAALFYAVLAVLAALWRVRWAGEPLFFVDVAAQERGVHWPGDLLLGLGAGALVIAISYLITRFSAAGELLARRLAGALGPLSIWQTTFLALISGFAEEVFFRGAVQPRVGLIAASVAFGIAHFVPRREFYLWTVFSVLAGALLGFLFEHTGNLIAPIAAHTLVNAVNLPILARYYRDTKKREKSATSDKKSPPPAPPNES